MTKTCLKCQQTKTHFHKNKNNRDGLSSVCVDCVSDYSKLRWAKNKKSESQRSKTWRRKNTEYLRQYEKGKKSRGRYWKHLTTWQALEEFKKLLSAQKECCAICQSHQSEFKKGLVIDHCHTTGKVRQLLCQNCNAMIGMAKESQDVLIAAIDYLNKHNTVILETA